MLNKLFTYAPVQVFSALSLFLVLGINTRFLKIDEYGLLALFLATTEVLRICSSQWVISTFVRFYQNTINNPKEDILSVSLSLIFILVIPANIILLAIGYFYLKTPPGLLLAISLILTSKSFFLFYTEAIRLSENVTKYRRSLLAQSISCPLATVALLDINPSISSALWGLIISYVIGLAVINPRISLKKLPRLSGHHFFYSYGIPLLFTGLIAGLNTRIDRFLIMEFLDKTSLGIYSALAAMLIGMMSLSFTVVALPIYPEILKTLKSPERLKIAHENYLTIILAITTPIFLIIYFMRNPLTDIFLGAKYSSSDEYVFLMILTSAYITNLNGHYLNHGLQFKSKMIMASKIAVLGLMINCIAGYILIKKLGILGASISALVTSSFVACSTWLSCKRIGYNFSINKEFKLVLLSNTLLCAFLFCFSEKFNQNLSFLVTAILALTALLTYCFLIILTNSFRLREKIMDMYREKNRPIAAKAAGQHLLNSSVDQANNNNES